MAQLTNNTQRYVCLALLLSNFFLMFVKHLSKEAISLLKQ